MSTGNPTISLSFTLLLYRFVPHKSRYVNLECYCLLDRMAGIFPSWNRFFMYFLNFLRPPRNRLIPTCFLSFFFFFFNHNSCRVQPKHNQKVSLTCELVLSLDYQGTHYWGELPVISTVSHIIPSQYLPICQYGSRFQSWFTTSFRKQTTAWLI